MMDFEMAAKLSGSRFVVLRQGLARLARAIGQFMIDLHVDEHGYTEIQPPLLVKDHVMFGTTQLPKFAEDQFMASRTRTREELLLEEPPQPAAIRTASPTGRSASFMRPTFSPSAAGRITLCGRS